MSVFSISSIFTIYDFGKNSVRFVLYLGITGQNYKIGIAVQAVMVCICSIISIINEIMIILKKRTLLFLGNDISHAIFEALLCFYSIGFFGSIGFYFVLSGGIIVILYLFTSFYYAWNFSNVQASKEDFD